MRSVSGRIHAGVIEPGHFRFMCLGEKVHHLEIQLGYQHRGVEKLLLRRPPMALAPVIESIPAAIPASPTPGATSQRWRP